MIMIISRFLYRTLQSLGPYALDNSVYNVDNFILKENYKCKYRNIYWDIILQKNGDKI